ncbi:tetratricopeptide repeat protein [Salinispira pacifica]|uniref:Uncharacterized protein n=1 Tax=Salinispira pacifica TaxID=1307761 RepID=V5WH69_9SPIO|nr:tetratricopeptide repeat protein [Salinispira pacifica]AHC15172.1 hypothetical protein L21SP2_1795 [Salinispira pacifica]
MKQKKSSDLAQARLLFAKKKYGQVISLLSPQIFLYRKDTGYHEMLGYACLYTGDFGGAYSYFQRARDLDPQRIDTLLGLAVVMLRRRKITEALRIWLEILDIDPANKKALKALEMAKSYEEDDWLEFIENRKYGIILAAHPRIIWPTVFKVMLAAVVIVLIPLAAVLINRTLEKSLPFREGQELLDIQIEEYGSGDYSRAADIIFTNEQLDEELEKVRRYFHGFRDNLVRYHGNRILYSNAPVAIKDRISLLISELREPDFTNFRDPFSYEEVAAQPRLHHGVYVRWKGRAANVRVSDEEILFDFLVGFHDGKVVEGTVPVLLDFAVELQGGEPVEIIAQVAGSDGELRLRGSSLRRMAETDG